MFTKKTYDYDMAIIGGGAAGLTVASGAAQLGVKVALIEAKALGGDCLFSGCVPSKALIKSAKVAHYINESSAFGLIAHQPKTDWQAITKRIQNIQSIAGEHDDPQRFREMGVDVIFGTAAFKDTKTLTIVDDKQIQAELTAKQIVIATGSSPFVPNIKGLERDRILTNQNIFTLSKQPVSMIIIGGGIIGCEMAQAFARLGTKVTIINRDSGILNRLDMNIQEVMTNVFAAEGITIINNANITKVKHGANHQVTYTQAGVEKNISAGSLLVATGRVPSIDKLHLDNAEIKHDRRGVIVNKRLRTNKRNIYAIGDCNGKTLFTHMAGHQGSKVVANAVLGIPSKADFTNVPAVVFTDPEIATCGVQDDSKLNTSKYHVHRFELTKQDRALTEGATTGFIKIITKRSRIVGVTIVAERAGDILPVMVIAITKKMQLSDLAGQIVAYPTLAEMTKQLASKTLAPKLFHDRVRRVLKSLYGYRGND